ncbi:DUF3488 and DUF4129 domain-containing transglutaminase family protein [Streptomyces sp. NPDC017979]|uniref:DUF3488 and DUF4129 domain-containing transglutaminase family protein n=1 Tax=Streptomyces sp. NPDC017979 TaxID=3365024 RepID=UPI00379D9D96
MSGRTRIALCAYAATLMAASALTPLLDSAGWLALAALLLAVQFGAGAVGRRVSLARPLTLAFQALVGLMLLTVAFARQEALLGVVPGPDVLARFGELLSQGGQDIERYAIPAPSSPGIELMVIGGVLTVGLMVDALAVTYRSAAPAGLPLLALYSVAAGLAGDSASVLWFLLAAIGYLLLLLAEGRDRLSQWGRVFGGASALRGAQTARSAGAPLAPVRTGRRIGVLALGVALVVPAALPALDGGLLSDSRSGSGSGSGGSTINAVNPLVSLQDSLNQPEDVEVLRYRTSAQDKDGMYLRFVALDQFDGTTWKTSERGVKDVPDRLPQPTGLSSSIATEEVQTNITASDGYRQDWLPMPYPATKVDIDGRWRFEPEGRTLVGDRGQNTRGVQYSVSSLLVKPTSDDLASAPRPPADIVAEYTKVPASLPDVVKETAENITVGARNDYESAVRLQDWFAVNGGFTYDTDVRSGTGVSAITRFLTDKRGFCVHFSFSMAAMARTLGIPARVAVGFTPGTQSADDTMSVSIRNAHAWPELYFEGVGWTRFEPTPSIGSVPDYALPEAPASDPSDPAAPRPSASQAPSEATSTLDTCPADQRQRGECESSAPVQAITPTGSGGSSWQLPLVVLAALVVVVLPLLPVLWRMRLTARRLGSRGRTAEDARARTLQAWLEVLDTAWDHGVPPDDALTARKSAERIVLLGRLEGEAADAVHRIAGAVEQVLYAPRPQTATGLVDDVGRVRAGLSAAAGRWERLRARVFPRSAVRVVWAASARWGALVDRARTAVRSRLPRGLPGLRRPSRQRG